MESAWHRAGAQEIFTFFTPQSFQNPTEVLEFETEVSTAVSISPVAQENERLTRDLPALVSRHQNNHTTLFYNTWLLKHHHLFLDGPLSPVCCILRSPSFLIMWNSTSSSVCVNGDISLGGLYPICWGHLQLLKCIPKDNRDTPCSPTAPELNVLYKLWNRIM